MAVHVVTIAMTTGARADQVGRLVAEHLGFQYISDEIIGRAAQHAGVSPRDVAEVEHSQSLIRRIITAMGLVALPELGMSPLPLEVIDPSASYRRLIQEVIREVAVQGRVVILAHGAGILLAGAPGVLRVLVTASLATRAQRLVAKSNQDEREATREIQRADRERRGFFKRFFDLDEELPTHYDLVANTDVLSPEAVARVIACAAENA